MSDIIVKVVHSYPSSENLVVENDKYTSDEKLKYKVRDINLIKYNPNLFTNYNGGFFDLIGGNKGLSCILGFGVLGFLYRKRANVLRGNKIRIGIWNQTLYTLLGAGVGTLYSAAFFADWNILLNDHYAHFLLKRYKKSKDLNRVNIYGFNNVPNQDDAYYFTESYMNSYHM